jgi:putative nucleotidyltransferase with HDIG domain
VNPVITTLVFDWGDTLMRVFPQFNGPMWSWPEVSAVDGAADALSGLQDHYHLVIATNAPDSRSRQVRQALARVGLDRYFKSIFTVSELGVRKPDRAFFQAVESVLRQEPGQLMMVGDSYHIDVLGAQGAGWTAAWYNPSGRAAQGLMPLHDLEITHLANLPAVIESPRLPGYATCLSWLQGQEVPYSLLAHVHGVAAAAYQMAVWLRSAGEMLDPLLVHRGGLLHDLAKLKAAHRAPESRISHGELAALMLMDLNYPQLAEIVRRHQLFSLTDPDFQPQTWEQKLVYFADKIIEGGRLASVDERITALRQRYPQNDQRIARTAPALQALQSELCAAAGIPPDELIPRLRSAFYGN